MGNLKSSLSKVHFTDRAKELLSSKKESFSSSTLQIPEIVLKIMDYLPTQDLCRLSRVCHLWHNLHFDSTLMKQITFENVVAFGDNEFNSFMTIYGKGVCNQVESLVLNGTSVSDDFLAKVVKVLPNLKRLRISSQLASAKSIRAVSKHLNHLKSLAIWNANLRDFDFCNIGQYLHLEELDISGCTGISDSAMIYVALYFSSLRDLHLSNCKSITDNGLEQVLRHCKLLEFLDVCNVPVLTYPTIMCMRRYARNLKYINAVGTSLSEFGLNLLIHCAPFSENSQFTVSTDEYCQKEDINFGDLKVTGI